ncbi:MAG: hypothetical protein ABI806_23975 [Candidatus Solibacter sp.]
MNCSITLSDLLRQNPTPLAPDLPTQWDFDVEEDDSFTLGESTRERGLKLFREWAQKIGLRVRRSRLGESGTFWVAAGPKEFPVEVICSKHPRISLQREWKEPQDLQLAYVWLEDESVHLMRYPDVDARLQDAAFTKKGFYTKALSPNRKNDLRPFRKPLEVTEESAIATLMETGAFGDESEAAEYFRDNGIPSTGR